MNVDVCVYGATPAGCAAAVAAAQEGASVVVVEPSRWLGGILGAGIKPMQDCALPAAVGGLTRERVFAFGDTPPQIRESYRSWLAEHQVPVLYERRAVSADLADGRIISIQLGYSAPDRWGVPPETAPELLGEHVTAEVFIDASYEGDLLPLAEVSYRTGREARHDWTEEPAGVGSPTNWTPIDPYVVPGQPESGQLHLVEADENRAVGDSDEYTQAYNFRFYVTDDPTRRVPLTSPENYTPDDYELVGRYVSYLVASCDDKLELLERLRHIFPGWRNDGEYNYYRESLITVAPLGISRQYQDGDWPTRRAVWREHIDYLRGLHHFLSTDSRVPRSFREEVARLGLDQTMHPDTDGWPNQLYVRITRRMQGRYTVSHRDVLNQTHELDGVGLALYGVDCYPVRRYACELNGQLGVATEGDMFLGSVAGTGRPYPIPYRTITPLPEECINLLVPVCFSATYIAYASARMEPVFSVLGESAGVAAALSSRTRTAVQDLDFDALQARLEARGQLLEYTGAPITMADVFARLA